MQCDVWRYPGGDYNSFVRQRQVTSDPWLGNEWRSNIRKAEKGNFSIRSVRRPKHGRQQVIRLTNHQWNKHPRITSREWKDARSISNSILQTVEITTKPVSTSTVLELSPKLMLTHYIFRISELLYGHGDYWSSELTIGVGGSKKTV